MTGNITSLSKGKTGENTVIEDVEYIVDKLTDSDFAKAAVRVLDKIYNGKAGVLTHRQSLLTWLKYLGRVS